MTRTINRFVITGFAITLLLIASSPSCKAGSDDVAVVKRNYKGLLLSMLERDDSLTADLVAIEPEKVISDQVAVELHTRYPFDLRKIEAYMESQRTDGSWPDINYQDTKRSGWEAKIHADRIAEMCRFYASPKSKGHHSAKVSACIHKALGYWFTANPKCANWWYNEIGIPKTLGDAFLLIEDEMSEDEKGCAIRVMSQAKFGMTGQNKVWLAGNVLVRALLENNEMLLKQARDTIASEIVLGREEGIQSDWSFHQHGPQMQLGNYGLSFMSSMSFYARLFDNTAYRLDAEQRGILTSLINQCYRWTIWKRYMDVNALGRQLFHNAQIHKAYSVAFASEDLGMVHGYPKSGNDLLGHKHFHDSDYTLHRNASWMASLRMSSTRVIGTELINEDNLKGYYMGDGATYFYVNGDEYLNIFPLWDWRKVPGVTAYEDSAQLPRMNVTQSGNESCKVGGLGDGVSGMSAMQLRRDRLTVNKAWVFTPNYVICLGSGIKTDSSLVVTTSIDQCLKKADLLLWDGKDWKATKQVDTLNCNDVRLFHNNIGYIINDGERCVAETVTRTGQWHDVMGMYPSGSTSGDVVSLYIDHGSQPKAGRYAYTVIPASSPQTVAAFDCGKEYEIVKNDEQAQIVYIRSTGAYWVAAYSPKPVLANGETLPIEDAGVYLLTKLGGRWTVDKAAPFECE